jgi:hypothetical protein
MVLELKMFAERGDGHVLASMYRHLAHWPGYLGPAAGPLRPLHDDGELERLAHRTLVSARHEARQLARRILRDAADLAEARRRPRDAGSSPNARTLLRAWGPN